MVHAKIDMNDPENPISKVRKVKIEFTATYRGEDAWNQDQLIPKLEKYLWDQGFSLNSYVDILAWDKDNNPITKDEMNEYLRKKHGYEALACNSCPDPVKWKELEKLRMKEYYRQKEVLDDPHQGMRDNFNTATGEFQQKVIYVTETEDEKAKRLKRAKE